MKNALNAEFLKFHNYLMEGSRIDLKTFLGLAKPNQYSQSTRKQISSWFWGDNFRPKSPNPIYSTTVLYDMIPIDYKITDFYLYLLSLSTPMEFDGYYFIYKALQIKGSRFVGH